MTESSVRVGLRIRPLVTKEKGQNLTVDSFDETSLVFKGQTFTFDHVFGMDLSQNDLYYKTAAPMLKSFLEGYNCTIMAYGQTGSGKTYTMGTSDVTSQDMETQGLIPRFVNDLFENLNDAVNNSDTPSSFKIKVAFCEIYGEDVFDLLNVTSAGGFRGLESRTSLAVREDETGKVFVQGQNEIEVFSAANALEILSTGSHNRVTASTNMNAGSSRSHAVFTLTLEQTVGGGTSDGSQENEDLDGPTSTPNTVISKLTFVDLAGSERIKRTGAEGQRMKEGIQINSGLFNLGQVINCLADEQKIKNGNKSTFVPYRNSKLTHLLKDALGGNSQTLFLACVSPAESNDSESHSTLNYAKQARNIQNKPIRNMDKQQFEVMRMKLAAKVWMMKAVQAIFKTSSASSMASAASESAKEDVSKSFRSPTRSTKTTNALLSPSASTFLECQSAQKKGNGGLICGMSSEEELLKCPEVMEFINSVNASIEEKMQGNIAGMTPTPRKIRLSMGFNGPKPPQIASRLFGSPSAKVNITKSTKINPVNVSNKPFPDMILEEEDFFDEERPLTSLVNKGQHRPHRDSILLTNEMSEVLETVNQLDDSEQLVERMMDVINKEKKLLGVMQSVPSIDVNDDDNDTITSSASANGTAGECLLDNDEKIQEVDRLIQEKEEILEKLKDNMRGYAIMKTEFEKLVDEINNLEDEKTKLEGELEKAKKSNVNTVQLEKMKERMTTVTKELKKMKDEKTNKETAYKFIQKENKQYLVMEQEIGKLKDTKVSLMKQQKQSVAAYQKLKKDATNQLNSLKKSDVKKQQLVNSLKADLLKKERIIGHKERELTRMLSKLKACEEHITQLLKLQHVRRQKVTGNQLNGSGPVGVNPLAKQGGKAGAPALKVMLENHEVEHYFSSKSLIDQLVVNQIESAHVQFAYQQKGQELQAFNTRLQHEVATLQANQALKKSIEASGKLDDEDDEEDDDFAGLDAMQLLSEEARYELDIIVNKIQWSELEIERLSKYIDTYNTDLDELSLQLDTMNDKLAAPGDLSVVNPSWEILGKDVVFGLSIGQAQNMLLDLLQEKYTLLESSKQKDYQGQKTQQELQLTAKRYEEAVKQLDYTRKQCLQKIALVEKQRISEVWAILKANSLETNKGEGGELNAIQSQASQTSQQIALAHAQSLEETITVMKTQYQELLIKQDTLTTQLQTYIQENKELKIQSKLAAQYPVSATGKSESNALIISDMMSKFTIYWNKIGTSLATREEMLSHINMSNALLQDRVIMELESELSHKEIEITTKLNQLELFGKVFQQSVQSFLPSNISILTIEASNKLQSLNYLDSALFLQYTQMASQLPKLESMRTYLSDLMQEMWFNGEDVLERYPVLFGLLSMSAKELQQMVMLPTDTDKPYQSPQNEMDEEDEENEVVRAVPWNEEKFTLVCAFTQSCVEKGIVLTSEELGKYEAELKTMNVIRIQLTNEIISVRDQVWYMMEDLEMLRVNGTSITGNTGNSRRVSSDKVRRLSCLVTPAAVEDTPEAVEEQKRLLDLLYSLYAGMETSVTSSSSSSSKLITAMHQILCKKSLSNPPGSAVLLRGLQALPTYLTNIESSRMAVGNELKAFVDTFVTTYEDLTQPSSCGGESLFAVLSEGLEDIPFHQQSNLSLLFLVLQEIGQKLTALRQAQYDQVTQWLIACHKPLVVSNNALVYGAANPINVTLMEELDQKVHQYMSHACHFYHEFDITLGGMPMEEDQIQFSPMRNEGKSPQRSQSPTPTARETESGNTAARPLDGVQKMLLLMCEIVSDLSNRLGKMEGDDVAGSVEEPWLVHQITSLLDVWTVPILTRRSKHHHQHHPNAGLKQLLVETFSLQQEHKRLSVLYESMQELYRQDVALCKTLQDLEDFESQSKQDRLKVLSGNSKLLMEEEKIRKQGKKKVEILQEKCVVLYHKLQAMLTGGAEQGVAYGMRLGSAERVEVTMEVVLGGISSTTVAIVKAGGLQRDRLDLMRLHGNTGLSTAASTTSSASNSPSTLPLPPANSITNVNYTSNTICSLARRASLEVSNLSPSTNIPSNTVLPPAVTLNNSSNAISGAVIAKEKENKENSFVASNHSKIAVMNGGNLITAPTTSSSLKTRPLTASSTTNNSNNVAKVTKSITSNAHNIGSKATSSRHVKGTTTRVGTGNNNSAGKLSPTTSSSSRQALQILPPAPPSSDEQEAAEEGLYDGEEVVSLV